VKLQRELINAPANTVTFDTLLRWIEWDIVQTANCIDEVPMLADVAVHHRDIVGMRPFPAKIAAVARLEAGMMHQEFRQPRNALRDAPRFVRR
jgi:hypothetical protein